MKISIGKLVMHCLTACMPLLVPGDGIIGATEPTHQMDAINIVDLSCSDQPRSSIFAGFSIGNTCFDKMSNVHPSNFTSSTCSCIPRAHTSLTLTGLDRAQHVHPAQDLMRCHIL